MKCPTCNTWSDVLETRPTKDGVKRRRECANLHRFTTYEMELNYEELNVSTGRRVFNWMCKLLNGETRNVVQPRQGDLFEGENKQSDRAEKVLKNIMDSLARSKDEKQ